MNPFQYQGDMKKQDSSIRTLVYEQCLDSILVKFRTLQLGTIKPNYIRFDIRKN